MTKRLPTALAVYGLVTALLGAFASTGEATPLRALGFTPVSIPQGTLYLLLAATMLRYSRIAPITAALLLLLDTALLAVAFDTRHGNAATSLTAAGAVLCVGRVLLALLLLRAVRTQRPVIVIPMQSPEDPADEVRASRLNPEGATNAVASKPEPEGPPLVPCPKCSAPQLASATICRACGIDMPRYVAARQRVAELEARLGRSARTRES